MNSCIEPSIPAGITIDKLSSDIEMLLNDGHIDMSVLIEWAEKIDAVTLALTDLADLTENHLPHKTDGHCNGLNIHGNSLLSMIMDIHYTQSNFVDEIQKIKTRVLKILSGKEQFGLFK